MSGIWYNHPYEPEDFIPAPKKHYDTVTGYIDQIKLVGELLDPDTQLGAGVKAFLMAGQTIAGKIFGSAASSHPFFSYHEKHVEALATAINAAHGASVAAADFQRALRSAMATGKIRSLMTEYATYGVTLAEFYENTLMPNLMMERMHGAGEVDGFAVMQETGQIPFLLPLQNIGTLLQWRAVWWTLHMRSIGMLVMVGAQTELARHAIKAYNKRVYGLKSSEELIDHVAGQAAERRALEEQAHALRSTSAGNQRAILEPVNFSTDNAEFVLGIARTIARGGDIAQGKLVDSDPETAAIVLTKVADRLKAVANL